MEGVSRNGTASGDGSDEDAQTVVEETDLDGFIVGDDVCTEVSDSGSDTEKEGNRVAACTNTSRRGRHSRWCVPDSTDGSSVEGSTAPRKRRREARPAPVKGRGRRGREALKNVRVRRGTREALLLVAEELRRVADVLAEWAEADRGSEASSAC